MRKIIDLKRVTPIQNFVLLTTTLVLLIVVATVLMRLDFSKKSIDYGKADKYTFIMNSTEIKDRDIYWTLNNVIIKFLESYQSVEKMDTSFLIEYKYSGFSLEEYYEALDYDYKRYLSKKKYLEKAKNMISKMVTWNDNGFVLKTEDIISQIYKLDDYNGYLCELNTVNKEETAYIGIIFDNEKKEYRIFYIE